MIIIGTVRQVRLREEPVFSGGDPIYVAEVDVEGEPFRLSIWTQNLKHIAELKKHKRWFRRNPLRITCEGDRRLLPSLAFTRFLREQMDAPPGKLDRFEVAS